MNQEISRDLCCCMLCGEGGQVVLHEYRKVFAVAAHAVKSTAEFQGSLTLPSKSSLALSTILTTIECQELHEFRLMHYTCLDVGNHPLVSICDSFLTPRLFLLAALPTTKYTSERESHRHLL